MQAVCDSELKFIDVVARWPGSQHDSTIFNESLLKARFQRGDFRNGVLLGDAGYPCSNYIVTPLRCPETEAEKLYQNVHILMRNAVERSYGVVKKRFPALALGIIVKLKLALNIIIATFLLHNLAIIYNDTGSDFPEIEEAQEEEPGDSNFFEEQNNRDAIINNFFT